MLVIVVLVYWGGVGGAGRNFQSLMLKRRRSEKNECIGGFKKFLPQIFDRGLSILLVKKTWRLEASVSNIDLGSTTGSTR